MKGKFVIANDEEHVIVMGDRFDPFDVEYKPCSHAPVERLRLEKWWIWVCSECFMIRDLEHMDPA